MHPSSHRHFLPCRLARGRLTPWQKPYDCDHWVSPRYLVTEEVEASEIEKEKEICKEQLIKEGKPENMLEGILVGKIKKYCSEICLMEQEYIKDDKKKVKDVLGDVKIVKFVRFSLV